ncbi:DUF2269 domain-containing protein [Oceanobacillus luteolus]|uniref:DUF2269 family protein n=1 Tax=Oceanobacillus luteolus TaxID=1274358 RepID=A0ABW4HMK0_9BACI|nr:DUF2269 family protein [Oceanobacillus luteolus]MCM3740521.1 DUF2269 domain-containing protein [Oceanobacillus luteolus]
MTFYNTLVFIHIFSAILGMGPGLVMTAVVTLSKPATMSELKHSFKIRNTLHIFTMVGGILLLVTGLLMGVLHPYWFSQGWYITSLILYLVALAMGPFVLKPRSTPIKQMFIHVEGETIPSTYADLSKELFLYERIINILFIIIISLMILKPF